MQVDQLEPALRRATELGAGEVVRPMTVPVVGRFAMIADLATGQDWVTAGERGRP